MLNLFFSIMMIAIFGRLLGFAVRLSWGFFRVFLTLMFLPGIILFGFFGGLLQLALPLLAVAGIMSLAMPRQIR